MKLNPCVIKIIDEDGNDRWSTIIENMDTREPVCHIVSAATEEEAVHNAKEIHKILGDVFLNGSSQDLDLSEWSNHLRWASL